VLVCSECRQELDPRAVRVLPGPGAGRKPSLPHLEAG
jgi:hypothetical protein